MSDYTQINGFIENLITETKDACKQWMGKDENGNTVIIDPIEKKIIGAHYAMTHYAAALIIIGINENRTDDLENGISLLRGLLCRWNDDKLLAGFHFDFNNFALCIIHDTLSQQTEYTALLKEIEQVVVNTEDSNHFTINWLPLRMYVNKKRYEFTGGNQYLTKVCTLMGIIEKATYKDGYIEDRLPKGKSFNLQYDVASVAVLEFMNQRGSNYDISNSLSALINAIDPDGDINYLGRGCNQIFAWGLWIYLLKMNNVIDVLQFSLDYLLKHLPPMLKNNNILLNEFDGHDRYLWWDYHYCSVYTAHLLLWLVLAFYGIPAEKEFESKIPTFSDSGVKVVRENDYFAVLFSGRREYLAEKGPVIANLWVSQYGTICKGAFGPWLGMFGNKFMESTCVFRNYLGPIVVKQGLSKEQFKLAFPKLDIKKDSNNIIITFELVRRKKAIFNLPLLNDKAMLEGNIKILADDREVKANHIGQLKNQYGFISIYQTKMQNARNWEIHIKL